MGHYVAVDTNRKTGFWTSKPGYKAILLLIAVLLPPPQSMINLVSKVNPAGYQLGRECSTIADTMNRKLHPRAYKTKMVQGEKGVPDSSPLMTDGQAAQLAKIMLAIFFWPSFSGQRKPCRWAPPISWWP